MHGQTVEDASFRYFERTLNNILTKQLYPILKERKITNNLMLLLNSDILGIFNILFK